MGFNSAFKGLNWQHLKDKELFSVQ